MRKEIIIFDNIVLKVSYDKGCASQFSGHVDFAEVSNLTKSCPFCGDGNNKRELVNTHSPSYEIECECGAKMDGEYFSPEKVKTLKGYINCHKKAIQDVLDRWNWRGGSGGQK